jgi:N6-L-threonylcarbamoyladenine synthase
MKTIITLGIETSCDETGAAVYHSEKGLLSNTLYSQIELHKKFGGVVPELASRSQLEKINTIVEHALSSAQLTLDDIDVVAVTNRPGLPGSLLVGTCFAKALAWAKNKKLIGINHLEGHAFSAFIENGPYRAPNNPSTSSGRTEEEIPFPHFCLTASGGHTSLYLIEDFGKYTVLGQTQDDAAGEAFDKIAKLMELPYPGGPEIEKLAREAQCKDYFHYPRGKQKNLDFSFSGLKTAVLYDLVKKNAYDLHTKTFLKTHDYILKTEVASSLLVCIADIFKQKLEYALTLYPHIKAITFVGGVACNKYIAQSLSDLAASHNLPFFVPSREFCTDNAAMIAFVGNYKAKQGLFSDLMLDIG